MNNFKSCITICNWFYNSSYISLTENIISISSVFKYHSNIGYDSKWFRSIMVCL